MYWNLKLIKIKVNHTKYYKDQDHHKQERLEQDKAKKIKEKGKCKKD